ncbi:unnamed protein product [Caenorhabditis nigoni]
MSSDPRHTFLYVNPNNEAIRLLDIEFFGKNCSIRCNLHDNSELSESKPKLSEKITEWKPHSIYFTTVTYSKPF